MARAEQIDAAARFAEALRHAGGESARDGEGPCASRAARSSPPSAPHRNFDGSCTRPPQHWPSSGPSAWLVQRRSGAAVPSRPARRRSPAIPACRRRSCRESHPASRPCAAPASRGAEPSAWRPRRPWRRPAMRAPARRRCAPRSSCPASPFTARMMASGVAGASSRGISPGLEAGNGIENRAVQTEMPSISGGSPTALDR